jgi:hypothetical protein
MHDPTNWHCWCSQQLRVRHVASLALIVALSFAHQTVDLIPFLCPTLSTSHPALLEVPGLPHILEQSIPLHENVLSASPKLIASLSKFVSTLVCPGAPATADRQTALKFIAVSSLFTCRTFTCIGSYILYGALQLAFKAGKPRVALMLRSAVRALGQAPPPGPPESHSWQPAFPHHVVFLAGSLPGHGDPSHLPPTVSSTIPQEQHVRCLAPLGPHLRTPGCLGAAEHGIISPSCSHGPEALGFVWLVNALCPSFYR